MADGRRFNILEPRFTLFEVTFAARVGRRLGFWPPFGLALTVEMVKSLGSCHQLDEVMETYTECIRQACDVAIPRKSSERRLTLPWLQQVKRDARRCGETCSFAEKCRTSTKLMSGACGITVTGPVTKLEQVKRCSTRTFRIASGPPVA
ncbi:hypothetical protein EVAR_60025_1 [Eumeta japonica]|uniref:Uncharacterized protein n=1 Tax=Eumeta variegata TaxID=151549 RepID=A0A4C1ZJJ0_EUMVA|nr:hypothetical protein EVAR_60025_1 [Eumeta japonica]